MENQGIQLPVAQVPASEAKQGTPSNVYPLVEELTFRAIIQNEAEGYALLRAVQILVNEFGASSLISVMAKMEAKPALMQKAKSSLPYLLMM